MTGTVWLIVALVALVAGYLGWSSWRESMHQRQAQRMFVRTREKDELDPPGSLTGATLPEPFSTDSLGERGAARAVAVNAADPNLDPELALWEPPASGGDDSVLAPSNPVRSVGLAEPSRIEVVASLLFDKPGRVSLTHLLDRLQGVGCGLRAQGLNAEGVLEPLEPNTLYQRIDVYLLLASRRGPVGDGCVSRFLDEMQVFSSGHALSLICPGGDEITTLAQELDAFCAMVDVLTSLSVVAPAGYPFRSSAIHRLATDLGMKWNATGVYTMQGEAGESLFSLANREPQPFNPGGAEMATHGFSLNMEVPRVANGLTVFTQMTSTARMLADRLSGQVVDADGRELMTDRLQADRRQLQDIYERMSAYGIPAGSEAALRVFA